MSKRENRKDLALIQETLSLLIVMLVLPLTKEEVVDIKDRVIKDQAIRVIPSALKVMKELKWETQRI